MMKPKTKAFADTVINNPGMTQTQAYIDTHKTNSVKTARVESTKLLKKPSVQIYMKKHEQMAKRNVVEMANDKSVKVETRLKANQDILDRNIGKSVVRSESHNLNLNVDIAASKELSDDFTAFLKQRTAT